MNQILLFIGLVIILCLTIKPVGKKLPFPTLLIFIALGMLLGVNGPAHIDFSDYALTETVCSTALLFIMFYGGFNTNIDRAKPVAVPAVLLSTLGVVITAGITGVFAHFVLGFDWIGGLLLGSVVASTDAASVFSVLREHSLSLRGGTDSLLEVESGSNDPVAYMAHRRARDPRGGRQYRHSRAADQADHPGRGVGPCHRLDIQPSD